MTTRGRHIRLVIFSQIMGVFISVGQLRVEDAPALKFLFSVDETGRYEKLQRPVSIGVDMVRSEIYIADAGERKIFLYDETGRFLQEMGRDLEPKAPYGLFVHDSGNLVVAEQDLPRLELLDHTGSVVGEVPLEPGESERFLPGGMCSDRSGMVYVCERFGDKVLRVDLSERRSERWPFDPGGQDDAVELQDILPLGDGKMMLLSSKGSVVRVVDGNGKVVRRFGMHGAKADEFSFPTAFALGREGRVWIVDTFQHSVKVFNQDGSFFKEYGRMGSEPGNFFFPNDIAFGKDGRLYVLDGGNRRLQAFQVEE